MRAKGREHRGSLAWLLLLCHSQAARRPQSEDVEQSHGQLHLLSPTTPSRHQPSPRPGSGRNPGSWLPEATEISGSVAAGADQDGETPRRMQPSIWDRSTGAKGLNEKPGRAPTGRDRPRLL